MPFLQAGSGGAGALTSVFDSTLGAPAANIDTGANGVPQTFNGLLIVLLARCAGAVNSDTFAVTLNNDGGANYDSILNQNLSGTIASASSFAGTKMIVGNMPGANSTASYAGEAICFIHGYTQTTFFKSCTSISGFPLAAITNSQTSVINSSWRSTSAITRIAVAAGAGSNLVAGSRMTIYGIQ